MLSSMSVAGISQADINSGDYGQIAHQGYDYEGNTFDINHVNGDKLPKMVESGSLEFEIPPNIIPEPSRKP